MSITTAPTDFDLDFNFGRHGWIDPPPVLFHAIRVPCACGRSLDERVYTFFPGSVFVHGVCSVCGPQTAIFAPHMKGMEERMPEYLNRMLTGLMAFVERTWGQTPDQVVSEFVDFLARVESERLTAKRAAESGTELATA